MRILGVILTLVCGLCPAWAGPKVAVLEAIGPPKTPTARLMSWTDAVRGVVLKAAPAQYVVLTRSNIEAFLPPGLDLADCEGECEITTARKIGAEYVIGIRVVAQGGDRTITVGLHAAVDGRLLGQGRQTVPIAQLEAGLKAAAVDALAVWSPAAQPAVEESAAQVVHAAPIQWMGAPIVRIDSIHGVVISRGGRRIGHTPLNVLLEGQTRLEVRAEAPGYRPQTFDIQTGGSSGKVVLDLVRNDASVVFDVPFVDIEVHVDGSQSLQGQSHTIQAGRHRFHVIHPCMKTAPIDVALKAGSTQTISVPHTLRCGRVTLTSPTPGAQVRWADKWVDLPFSPTPKPTSEPGGDSVTVAIRAPGHLSIERAVIVPPSGVWTVNFALLEDWVAVKLVARQWTGEMCSGLVFIDGEQAGNAPWRGRLTSGKHVFKVECGDPEPLSEIVWLGGRAQTVVLEQRGNDAELGVAFDGLEGATLTARLWTRSRTPGHLRLGIGAVAGVLGYADAVPVYGLELGAGLPLTTWFELGAFATGTFGVETCPPNAEQEDCSVGYGTLRGMARVAVGDTIFEAGWGLGGHTGSVRDSRSHHGIQFGLSQAF